ncbi:MAG: CmcJ/NvfI family oxidoreductase [Bradymonadia bacterium]
MTRTGTVNYHVHSDERQAYHIDAGGVSGKLISPSHVVTDVCVRDVRLGEASVSFSRDSVTFEHAPTQANINREDETWRPVYDEELIGLLWRTLGVKEVIVFDHTVRVDDPQATRKPARNVHTDYSPEGARRRLDDILGAPKAAEWARGHYAFINVWRPIGDPINSAPLGFVRPSTVPESDWVLIDLVYPDRIGHIMGLVANDDHEWVYQSSMTPDEVAVFNIYDNRGLPSIGHSALDLVEREDVHTVRRSIESRTLVRY